MSEDNLGARIFLVDDHPAVRHGLSLLFNQSRHGFCGQAGSIAEALEKLDKAEADIVLVDLSLDNESGLDLLVELNKRDIKSIVYSMHDNAEIIEKAFKAGANGYVTKRDSTDSLLDAVETVMSGERYTSLHAAQSLAKNVLPGENNNLEAHLSKREQMILAELRRGNTTDEISQELNISPRTVESYYARIIEKLNLDGMKSLRRYAFDTERDRPVL